MRTRRNRNPGAGRIHYTFDYVQQATLRTGATGADSVRTYPGVRAEFSPGGAVVFVRAMALGRQVRTAYYLRNR